jgi:hypothetical protein
VLKAFIGYAAKAWAAVIVINAFVFLAFVPPNVFSFGAIQVLTEVIYTMLMVLTVKTIATFHIDALAQYAALIWATVPIIKTALCKRK